MKNNEDPFLHDIPSVFVVWSPFQILCAVAAIHQLHINDYLFLIKLPKGGARNNQIIEILKFYHINYKRLLNCGRLGFYYYVCRALFYKKHHYRRLFIGDFRDCMEHFVGCGYVSDNADVVYLDDGAATINLFQESFIDPNGAKLNKILNRISEKRRIQFRKNFLTVYSDIPNSFYNIRGLYLNSVLQRKKNTQNLKEAIVIVGTYAEEYCDALQISEQLFVDSLDEVSCSIRKQNPNRPVFYFPHGRENGVYDKVICDKYNFNYNRPHIMVEMEVQLLGLSPIEIYGYSSNALFVLKKMYPDSKVINLLFKIESGNNMYKQYVSNAIYFQNNGIELLSIPS